MIFFSNLVLGFFLELEPFHGFQGHSFLLSIPAGPFTWTRGWTVLLISIMPSKSSYLVVFMALSTKMDKAWSLFNGGNKNDIRRYNIDRCHEKEGSGGHSTFIWL